MASGTPAPLAEKGVDAHGVSRPSAWRRGRLRAFVAGHLAVATLAATAAAAQMPGGATPLVFGPALLYPSFVLRDVGFDSNIRNADLLPQADFTLTAEPRARIRVPFGFTQITSNVAVGFVYFAKFKDQQALNRSLDGRFEWTTLRLRPFVEGLYAHTRQRQQFEIDARILRRHSRVAVGAELRLTPLTSFTAAYRHETENYGEEAPFPGAALADQLDRGTHIVAGGMQLKLSALTSAWVEIEVQQDRFRQSQFRDADSVRLVPGIEFAPGGVVRGKAGFGYRHFSPRDPRVAPFDGVVGAADVTALVAGMTRVTVNALRDVEFSFDPLSPNYLVTSGRLTVSQWIGGPIDLIGTVGADRLDYSRVIGLPQSGRVERTRSVGGGVGFRVSPSFRVTLIYDVTSRRTNTIDRRDYDRRRLFGGLSYEL